MQLTPEQQAIIDTNHHLVINAVAGSGKTTTLVEYAKSRQTGSRILCLAFNKTVKTEAIQKFAAAQLTQVTVATAHSLAYDHVMRHSRYQVVPGYKSYDLCELLEIATGDRHTDFIIANHVIKFMAYFCNSRATRVQELNYTDVITDAKAKIFVNNFYPQIEQYTRAALAKMDRGDIAVTHDFYLKKFQLSNPVLPYDYILFDEGQDASPAMLEVFLQQAAIKIIVGDVHQQIYGWRFAVNSLQQVDFPVYHLSSSFRFDDEIALVANKVLALKKHLQMPPVVKVIGAGTSQAAIVTRATLSRTNLGLLLNAIAQWQHGEIKTIYFEGNINSYTFADEGASLYDILSLYNGKADKIKDKLIASMTTMRELEDYIEKTEDTSLGMIVEVVKEFGNRLPALINELKSNHTTKKEDADMIFSTVHRCKGMEYDEVTLLDDFINQEKLQKYITQFGGDKMAAGDRNRLSEEINVLYVAVTRAKKKNKLKIPPAINPLQTVQVIGQEAPVQNGVLYKRASADTWWDQYAKSQSGGHSSSSKAGNSGQRWSEEHLCLLEALSLEGNSIKAIGKALERTPNSVKMKLIQLGLIDEGADF